MTVTLGTRTVGQSFGTVGVALDADGKILAEGMTRPYGFRRCALSDVQKIANEKGWKVL